MPQTPHAQLPEARKQAMREATARWRAAHPEKVRARKKDWMMNSPGGKKWAGKSRDRIAFNRWKRGLKRYGLTPESYNAILASQQCRCKVCRALPFKIRFAVDHDHSLERPDGTCPKEAVRGLLCKDCNLMLGHARDSVLVLEAGIRYLADWGTRDAVR